jgi:hypothetical protein
MNPTRVRAKFTCTRNEPTGTDNSAQLAFEPVYDGSEENREFFKWTPGGQIKLGVVNQAAAAMFVVGQEYYVDFTPAGHAVPQAA